MSRKRNRTPVQWPTMKIRGARRKRITADRTRRSGMMWVVLEAHTETGGVHSYQFKAAPSTAPGARLMKYDTGLRDGWGRRVDAA